MSHLSPLLQLLPRPATVAANYDDGVGRGAPGELSWLGGKQLQPQKPPLTPSPGCPQCRATVSQDCITAFNELKLNKKYKYIVFKLSDNYKEIVVEEASDDKDWDNFREKLINATAKSKSVRLPLIAVAAPPILEIC